MTACTKKAEMFSNTDKFKVEAFDHLEFFVGDAVTATRVLKFGLGMTEIARTNRNLHNYVYTSHVLRSGNITFAITSPYLSEPVGIEVTKNKLPNPAFDPQRVSKFITQHGSGVGAMSVRVADVRAAFDIIVANGGTAIVPPTLVTASEEEGGGSITFAEILVYEDDLEKIPSHMPEYAGLPVYQSNTVLRLIQRDGYSGFWPGYTAYNDPVPLDYGLNTIDHVVGNVYRMDEVVAHFKRLFGFHTFAFFTPEEIHTQWTSLNSEVLASNDARVLLPINEPAPGKAESQILTYLRYFNGPGVQHIAIKTNSILETMLKIKQYPFSIDFLDAPDKYYELPEIQERLKSSGLTDDQIVTLKKLGILIDIDDGGCLLQIFTKPLFDRPTVFVEIIQRICYGDEIPGCGRFGSGNFKALFISLEPLLNPNIPK